MQRVDEEPRWPPRLTLRAVAWTVALLLPLSSCVTPGRPRAPIERSVVRIENFSQTGNWNSPWDSKVTQRSSGSGFVIEGGVVMTNAHVVSDARMLLLYRNGDPDPHEVRVVSVGHDCDLALVEPLEPGLLDGMPALKIGDLPSLGSTVETFGYPSGGEQISATRGVVSRIEVNRYSHSALDSHLTVQTDAAINPGNSGGPVIQDGKVVGVAFQAAQELENVGYFIPTEVVLHFLEDLRDGRYDGYPDVGALWSKLENPAARKAAGLGPADSGVRVDAVFPGSSADGSLREGDVVVAIDGHEVANDGSVAVWGLRLDLGVILDRHQVGERAHFSLARDGVRTDVEFPLSPYAPAACYRAPYDVLPRYYVYAGLVFVPLCRGAMAALGDEAETHLSYEYLSRAFAYPERLNSERVILLRRLDHPVNVHMTWSSQLVVERVNGVTIRGLADVVEAIEGGASNGEFHLFEFGYFGRFSVIRRDAADRAHQEILRRYGVPADRRL